MPFALPPLARSRGRVEASGARAQHVRFFVFQTLVREADWRLTTGAVQCRRSRIGARLKEMLMPIEGKKAAKETAAKKQSARQRKSA
jgi:hypothetical protein